MSEKRLIAFLGFELLRLCSGDKVVQDASDMSLYNDLSDIEFGYAYVERFFRRSQISNQLNKVPNFTFDMHTQACFFKRVYTYGKAGHNFTLDVKKSEKSGKYIYVLKYTRGGLSRTETRDEKAREVLVRMIQDELFPELDEEGNRFPLYFENVRIIATHQYLREFLDHAVKTDAPRQHLTLLQLGVDMITLTARLNNCDLESNDVHNH